jgi:putative transposase
VIRSKLDPLSVPDLINEVCSMNCMHGHTQRPGTLRLLSVIGDFNREALAIEVDFSLSSERVIRGLAQIIERRGKPKISRRDTGLECLSASIVECEKNQDIRIEYIQPGKPQQNA